MKCRTVDMLLLKRFFVGAKLLAGTALFCRQAPPRGGATCFADAVAAWNELPLNQQELLQMLQRTSVHFIKLVEAIEMGKFKGRC